MSGLKRFTSLSPKELSELTDEQVDNYIDLEIAFSGIKMLNPPVYKDISKFDIEKSVEAYSCRGKIFKKEEDAVTFSKMEVVEESYDYNIDSAYKWLKSENQYSDVGVKTLKYYNKEDVTSIGVTLKKNKNTEQNNSDLKYEWNDYQKEISDIKTEIYDAISDAKKYYSDLDKAKEDYDRYLRLSGDDVKIAKNFFYEAYKDDKEELVRAIIGDEEFDVRTNG